MLLGQMTGDCYETTEMGDEVVGHSDQRSSLLVADTAPCASAISIASENIVSTKAPQMCPTIRRSQGMLPPLRHKLRAPAHLGIEKREDACET